MSRRQRNWTTALLSLFFILDLANYLYLGPRFLLPLAIARQQGDVSRPDLQMTYVIYLCSLISLSPCCIGIIIRINWFDADSRLKVDRNLRLTLKAIAIFVFVAHFATIFMPFAVAGIVVLLLKRSPKNY